MRKNSQGQMSIFFGIMIMVVLSLTALVINVGLFVKAKINLQNAVDAAAYSGAAVQSRQLTSIAYLNWEMRNVYKEWMFKYYVLGNIGLRSLNGPGPTAPLAGGVSNFQMRTLTIANAPIIPGVTGQADIYNVPSVCIQFQNTTADCDTYKLPALPRFPTSTTIGIANTADVFTDTLSGIRSKNCSDKSNVNFEVAAMWAFSTGNGNDDLASSAPQILSNRPGAYPKAFELAVRVRNLESLLNEPPITNGICAEAGNAAGSCAQGINNLNNQDSPHLERSVKAFYSGYRNLGNESDSEMKASFTLTEIPPKSDNFNTTTLSGMLYPGTTVTKHYADLRAMPINYATFYTAFVTTPTSTNSGINGGNFNQDVVFTGGCDSSKIAIPVPGYLLGFVKNPDFLTYYAVKGEANFVGLFNPFQGAFTKLTAYSVAKPFGGRIGPAIFNTKDNTVLKARGTQQGYRSRHYAAAFDIENARIPHRDLDKDYHPQPLPDYILGAPIPLKDFWVESDDDVLGGEPVGSAEGDIRFAIPNLVWSAAGSQSIDQILMTITPAEDANYQPFGLYSFDEYNRFKTVLGANGSQINAQSMSDAVLNIKAPTDYEAFNYLIPSTSNTNKSLKLDSFAPITGTETNGANNWSIYAPLYEARGNFPYKNNLQFRDAFKAYTLKQKPAIDMYLKTMKKVSDSVLDSSTDPNFSVNYQDAAEQFSDADDVDGIVGLSCSSMAGSFYHYFLGQDSGISDPNCPEAFFAAFAEYWNTNTNQSLITHYQDQFGFKYFQPGIAPNKFFTGYAPGPRQGADVNGNVQHPVFSQNQTMIRNFYSTKFVAMQSVAGRSGQGTYNDSGGFANFSQGRIQPFDDMRQKGNQIQNTIDPSYIHFNIADYLK